MKVLGEKTYLLPLALVIGAVVDALEALFSHGLNFMISLNQAYYLPLVLALPLVGLVIVWIYQRYSPESLAGMSLIFNAVHQRDDNYRIPPLLIPIVIVATWLTHLVGGSAGREGVAVQIGATMGQQFDRWFKDKDQAYSVIFGIAAGFAGLFGTPLAATFFALELLTSGRLLLSVLLPTMLAAYTSLGVSSALKLHHAHFTVDLPQLSHAPVWQLIVMALIFSLAGQLFAHGLEKGKAVASHLMKNPYLRVALGGIILAALLLLTGGRYSGLGEPIIEAIFNGGQALTWDWLWKLALTVLTLSIGFQGGEVTPMFTIGTCLGYVLAPWLGLPNLTVAALGYVTVFAVATNTVIAPMLITMEIFGPEIMPWALPVILLAYSLNGNFSVYGQQKIME
ncbi:hypothetical protein AWM75_03170 [Aerococcus urinaehominis]|uniref:Uncharacterized protein n=1 Tax=Aerococcus urinaehominis TaxID=128944 RepID=A0A0X8FKM7_9LACT|nr:chloride channel protein [Aerococcus urinaehominis]AMB99062.1 hypothetical protein AWM75_03170 [Aerococcus urinaehominis]SDM59487.1 H+/Cl-antiporter ClcA [Aerococcus urinaehominis]